MLDQIARIIAPIFSEDSRYHRRHDERCHMPFLFLMVLPTMMWDTLMLPAKQPTTAKDSSQREGSRESSREPWGRLTP